MAIRPEARRLADRGQTSLPDWQRFSTGELQESPKGPINDWWMKGQTCREAGTQSQRS
jgi:hypothetical protein